MLCTSWDWSVHSHMSESHQPLNFCNNVTWYVYHKLHVRRGTIFDQIVALEMVKCPILILENTRWSIRVWVFDGSEAMNIYRIMYVLAWRTVYALTRVLFWCLWMNTKITFEWVHKQFVTRVYTLFYFLHDITNPWMTLKTRIFTHHSRVSLARFTFCWWRHNRLAMTSQWQDKTIVTRKRGKWYLTR